MLLSQRGSPGEPSRVPRARASPGNSLWSELWPWEQVACLPSAFCLHCPRVSFLPPEPKSLPGDLIQHHGSTHHLYTHDPQLPSPARLSPELQTPASSCFLPISTSVSNRTLRLKTRPLKIFPKPALCLPVAFNGKYSPRRLNTTFGDFLDAGLSHTHIQSISVSCRLCLPHQPRDGHCSPLPPAPLPPLSKVPPPTAWWLPNWSLCLPRPVLSRQPSDSSVN